MSNDTLSWLQQWYLSQCDGEWEHHNGIRIDSLDNPGWSVEADIGMITKPTPISEERNDSDWIRCEVKEGRFYGYGGPRNLQEMLEVLRRWIEDSSRS